VATVLVVDDSSTIRRILRRDLEAAGYGVSEAADGEIGLAMCRAVRPDLVLLDVDMPVLDGMATLERMQADPDLRHLPVLFLTARTSGPEAARGLSLGAHDYLKKPCDQAELLARVAAALRQRAREQSLASRAQELAQLSTTDPLTGLLNRRGLEQHLRTLSRDRSLGVLLLDIDHFKRVNDTEGHAVGDAVLAVVAARLRSSTGTSGTVGRWGGEEFVTVAADVDGAALAELGERLRECVACFAPGRRWPRPVVVTLSVGTALGTAVDFQDLLRAADTALYEAKAGGRNRVVASS
jgi:diguanylate cyclase (GGDEF)-like protein